MTFAIVFSSISACAKSSNLLEKGASTDITEAEVPLNPSSGTDISSAVASGKETSSNNTVYLDYSNSSDGYLMIKYIGTNSDVKTLITGPSNNTYTYNQSTTGEYDVYPLSDGNGIYRIAVYENISGNSYSTAFSIRISITLKDEFAPFLIPNKFVNYNSSSKVVSKAFELCSKKDTTLQKIEAIYGFVINNFTYDYELAKNVKSGYIPDLDEDLEKKTGICFDYAAVMAAMLRSQGIPTKMVFGYTGSLYHAWISTYSNESGWITAYIYFDGNKWKLMDPTFASSAESSAAIMKYIGNENNYVEKYLY